MSDPRSNVEIMDVLSSIRRLVSEDRKIAPNRSQNDDLPPETDSQTEVPAGVAAAPVDDRFVLTPALRVAEVSEPPARTAEGSGKDDGRGPDQRSDAEAAWALDAEADENSADSTADPVRDDFSVVRSGDLAASLEDTIAELEAAVAEIETEFEPDGGDLDSVDPTPMPDGPWPTAPELKNPTGGFQGIMAGFDVMSMAEERLDAPITADGPPDAPPHSAGDFRRAAPTYVPVERPRRPLEPVTAAAVADDAGEPTEPADAVKGTVPQDVDTSGEAGAEPGPDDAAEVAEADTLTEATVSVAAEIAQPEAAAAGGAAGRLHFGGHAAGRPLIFRPDSEAQSDEPLTLGPVDDGAEDEGGDADLFDPLNASDLDIGMLRDIVTEIIREELRGTLGERITRNLRQLVRREIERALVAENVAKD